MLVFAPITAVLAISLPVFAAPDPGDPSTDVASDIPVDEAGRWKHVITLNPSVLVWPHSADRIHSLDGFGLDPAGGLVLVGEGDILHLSSYGVLDRDAWDTPEAYPWVKGHVVVDAEGVWGCDPKAGVVQFRRDGTQHRRASGSVEVGSACALYRNQEGDFVGWHALTRTVTVFDDDGTIKQQGRIPAFADTGRETPTSVGPCGALVDGTSLSMGSNEPFDHLRMLTLDQNLVPADPAKPVLELDTTDGQPLRQPLGVAKAWDPRYCGLEGDYVTLAYWHQGIVMTRDGEIESWLRNKTPLTASAGPSVGQGPFGFDGLDFLHVLDQRTLVAVSRRQGMHLYRPALLDPASPERARELAARGDLLGAEQNWSAWLAANPDHPDADAVRDEQLEGWIAAGWWANAISAGKKHPPQSPLFARALEARARSLTRWTQRRVFGGGPLFAKEAPDPRGKAREYLDELLAFADDPAGAHPAVQEALLHLAIAARRPHTARTALSRLEALDPRVVDRPIPDAFWVYVGRGSARTVDRLLQADPGRAPDAHAAALRLARRPDAALALIGDQEGFGADFMRAECLSDLGRLTEALDAWTSVVEAAPDHPSAHAGLGLTYLRRGLPELAVQSFLKSLDLEENPAVRSNLGMAFAALDDRERARQVLKNLDPDEPVVHHQLNAPAPMGSKRAPLAVLPLDVAGGTTPRVGLGDLLATLAVTELVEGGNKVVERTRLDALTAELDLSASAYVDPDAAVELGKLAGAKQLILGNVAEFPDRAVIDLRLVEVKSGKVLKTAHADALLDVEALRTAMATTTRKLLD